MDGWKNTKIQNSISMLLLYLVLSIIACHCLNRPSGNISNSHEREVSFSPQKIELLSFNNKANQSNVHTNYEHIVHVPNFSLGNTELHIRVSNAQVTTLSIHHQFTKLSIILNVSPKWKQLLIQTLVLNQITVNFKQLRSWTFRETVCFITFFLPFVSLSVVMPISCNICAMSRVLIPQLLATFFWQRLCTFILHTVKQTNNIHRLHN